jgi:hypothetical protein
VLVALDDGWGEVSARWKRLPRSPDIFASASSSAGAALLVGAFCIVCVTPEFSFYISVGG